MDPISTQGRLQYCTNYKGCKKTIISWDTFLHIYNTWLCSVASKKCDYKKYDKHADIQVKFAGKIFTFVLDNNLKFCLSLPIFDFVLNYILQLCILIGKLIILRFFDWIVILIFFRDSSELNLFFCLSFNFSILYCFCFLLF